MMITGFDKFREYLRAWTISVSSRSRRAAREEVSDADAYDATDMRAFIDDDASLLLWVCRTSCPSFGDEIRGLENDDSGGWGSREVVHVAGSTTGA